MASSEEFILTWKLKNFSRMILRKGCLSSSNFLEIGSTGWCLDIVTSNNEDNLAGFIACYVRAFSNSKVKNLSKLNLSLDLIDEKSDIICSKSTNSGVANAIRYGWDNVIKTEELRSYFTKSKEDVITFRCCIKGSNNSTNLRMDVVSYWWEIDRSELSRDHVLKEHSICDLFPFKLYLIKLDDEILFVPKIVDSTMESYLYGVYLYSESLSTVHTTTNFSENSPAKTIRKKISDLFQNSELKKMFIRCDTYLKDKKDESLSSITKITDFYVNSDSSLPTDMKNMLLNKIHCDVQLRVAGKEISAHRSILSARSPVFSAMFTQDMLEANSGIVDITDCELEVFDAFVQFIYTGELNATDFQTVSDLLVTANKYQIPALTERCSAVLKSLLSVGNVCKVLFIADLVNASSLLESAIAFIMNNSRTILESSKSNQ